MSTQQSGPHYAAGPSSSTEPDQPGGARVGTVVWGLVVVALAALIIISKLGVVVLNANYVLIGLMIGAGAALIIGGLVSARSRGSKASEPGPAAGTGNPETGGAGTGAARE